MDLELKGKRVLITGASKGLGLAMATRFAQEGCNLELVARTRDQLQAVANTLHKRFGVQIMTHALDLAVPGVPLALADSIGTVDILVNNAGEELGDENAWPQIIARMNLPAGRAASPAEIADVVAFLSSSRASYVTGTVVTVDGGLASASAN